MKKEKKSFCRKIVSRLLSICIILMLVAAEFVMPVMAAGEGDGGDEKEPKYDTEICQFGTERWGNIDLKNWMSKIPDCIQLSQLVIPGTHDSGMAKADCSDATKEYTICQEWFIPDQLEHGMRILDIRLWPRNGNLYVTHGPYYANTSDGYKLSFDKVLEWCKDFLKAHPTETICLRAKYESDPLPWQPDKSKETNKKIREYWEKLKNDQGFAYVVGDVVPTLGEVRGKIVFFHEFDGDMCTKYEDHYNQPSWNKIECYKRVLDTSGPINYIDSLDHFIKENLECYSKEDKNHRPEGEPEMKMVCTNVNTFHTDYPTEGPRMAFKKLYEDHHITTVDLFPGKHYGWIWMDFPKDEWTKKIIAVNPTVTDSSKKMYWGYDASTRTLYMGNSETHKHGNSLPIDTRYTGKYDTIPWSAYRTKIKKVVVDSEIHPSYTCGWFYGFTVCTEFDLANLKTDRVYMMDDMFRKSAAVIQLDISSFRNERVISAKRMFAECESLQTIFADDSFDLKNVTDTDENKGWAMFHYCSSLEGHCGTRYSYGMGKDAAHVDSPETPGLFSITNKGGSVYYGFSEDGKTMYLNNRKSDKTPNLNVMTVQEGKRVPSWYKSDAKSKVANVFVQNRILPESLDYWFQGFTDATVFDIDLIDMRVCTSAEHTFEGCTKVETIVLPPSWHTVACSSMFEGCAKLRAIYASEGSSMVDQTSSTRIFYGCTNLVGGEGTTYKSSYEPNGDYVMAHIDGGNTDKGYFTLKKDIYWGASNDTLYFSTTRQALTPNYLIDRKYDYSEGIITPWIDQRTHKTRVFHKVKVLEKIQPRHMSYWFYDCIGIEGTLNLSNIDTSLTLDMNYTFCNMGKVKTIDITGFSNASLISANSIFEGGAFGGQEVTTIYASRNFNLEKLQGPLDEKGYDPGKFLELDYNLVGGNGTKAIELFRGYRFDGPQAVYARVDVPGQTGLFTLKEDKGQTLYYGIGATRLYISSRLTEKTKTAFTDKMYTEEAPWTNMCQVMGIKTVEVLDEISPVYTANWFKDLSAVENFILDKLDTSATVNMDYMFSGCRWCKALDITNFVDVSVKSAKRMFFNSCFETIWVNDFDLTYLPEGDCWDMFGGCTELKGINGTEYSDEYVDNKRALYDGKDGKQGYFSSIKDKKYKITFTDDYKTTLQEVEVKHGGIPEFTEVLPDKKPTNYIEYVFEGWEPEIVPATKDAVYKGIWEPVDRIYAALFEDEDGKLLDNTFFLYGETPTTDVIPEKEETEESKYKFVSWKQVPTTDEDRQKISGVRGDSIIVYKPVFEEIPKEYTVTFVDDDGKTVLYKENFEYGAMPVYRGSTPSKSPDSEYYYTFEGWDPELTEVTANKTYKAKYKATPRGYVFTKGNGSVYTKGESLGLLFEVSGPYRHVVDETGTGMKIDEDWYWPRQIGGIDNTWFMMTPEDLNDLSAGEHTITVFYDNGQAPYAKFKVVDPQPETGVTVKKVDKDGNPLEGAILLIKDEDGNVVHRWETTAQGLVKVELEPGNYTLIEEVPPAGYKIAEPIAFTVSEQEGSIKVEKKDNTGTQEVDELVMVDEFLSGDLPTLDVIFVKKDGEGKRLKDAKLLVKKIGGGDGDKWQWTSSESEVDDKVINLKPGTYVMSEEEAPEGYLPAQSITFRVKTNPDLTSETPLVLVILSRDEHGDIVETPVAENKIEMIDVPEPLLTVKLSKTDKEDKRLAGAHLKVVGVDVNYTSETWISEDDNDKELSLSPGTYVMSEVLAPEGYLTAQNITFRVTDELGLFIVGENGTVTPAEKIVMVDKKKPVEADVTFAKVTEDNILLAGAELKVEGKDVEFSKTWTTKADENKKLTLPAGTYEFTETEAPEGYIKADAITFSVKAEDEVVIVEKKFLRKDKEVPVDYIVMTDALEPVPTANVEIARTDGEGNMIAGATLYVKETEGDYFRSWTSGEGKIMELPLLPSTYTITEKATPEGYKTPKTLTFRVKDNRSLVIVEKDDEGKEIEKRVDMVEMAGALKPVPSPTVDVVFVKSDEDGRPVEGAELTVTGKDIDFKESWSTTPLENKTLNLSVGTYLLKETKTPENYLTADPITFRVKEDLSLVLVEKDKQRVEIEIPVDYVAMIDNKAPVKYKIIEGAGSTWTKGSGVKHKFASDAPYDKFVKVKIDGKTVDSRNYTSSEGSTVVVFNAAYMETIAVGKHTIEIVSIDGSASANFNVAAKDSPPTGDNSKTALWLILMAAGTAGIATALILIKRRKD